jgi:hypothetical protein
VTDFAADRLREQFGNPYSGAFVSIAPPAVVCLLSLQIAAHTDRRWASARCVARGEKDYWEICRGLPEEEESFTHDYPLDGGRANREEAGRPISRAWSTTELNCRQAAFRDHTLCVAVPHKPQTGASARSPDPSQHVSPTDRRYQPPATAATTAHFRMLGNTSHAAACAGLAFVHSGVAASVIRSRRAADARVRRGPAGVVRRRARELKLTSSGQ